MSGQIRLRRRSANVRKFKALLKIGGADQYSMRHTLGQLNDSWRRRKACDSAAPKSSCSFGSTSYLQYWNIFDGLKAQSFDQNPRGNIRGASHTTDADAFTSQIFRRLDRFLNHQLVRQRIEKARDHDEIRAPDSGARPRQPSREPTADATQKCRRRTIDGPRQTGISVHASQPPRFGVRVRRMNRRR